MTYKIGETYHIKNSRKGAFLMKVTGQCDTWLKGIIVEGRANAMMYYNTKGMGDEITIRKSMTTGQLTCSK